VASLLHNRFGSGREHLRNPLVAFGPTPRIAFEPVTHLETPLRRANSCPNRSTTAVLLVAALTLVSAQAQAARTDPPVTRAASAHFSAGVAYLEGKDPDRYNQAYREFKAAYAASPSWKILGNLGIVAQELERYGEALDAYEKYLEEGKGQIDAAESAQVRRDIELIRRDQAAVTLGASAGPFRVVDIRQARDGKQIVNEYGPFDDQGVLVVRAGRHEFRVDRDGAPLPSWSIALLPGDSLHHVFEHAPATPAPIDPRPPEEPPLGTRDKPNSSHALPYVLWGGGVAAGATSIVLLLEAHHFQKQADADFDRDCPGGVDPSNPRCASTTAGDAKAANWRTAALISGVAASTAVIGGAVAYWMDLSADSSAADEAASARPDVRAWVGLTSLGIQGSF
jgi:hypothetical protein